MLLSSLMPVRREIFLLPDAWSLPRVAEAPSTSRQRLLRFAHSTKTHEVFTHLVDLWSGIIWILFVHLFVWFWWILFVCSFIHMFVPFFGPFCNFCKSSMEFHSNRGGIDLWDGRCAISKAPLERLCIKLKQPKHKQWNNGNNGEPHELWPKLCFFAVYRGLY